MSKSKSESTLNLTIKGFNWNASKTYLKAVLNFIVGIVLARLLTPEDFGLLGMIIIFTGLADLFATLGIGMSIVKLKNLNENHLRSGFTLTILISLSIYLFFFFLAPLVADFYNREVLIDITRTIALLFVFRGFATVGYGKLMRKIDFKSIFIIEMTSFALGYSLFAIVFSVLDFGVWSLIYGRIISSLLFTLVIFFKTKIFYKPQLNKKALKELLGFGSGFTFSRILTYFSGNIDYLLIGRLLSATSLGFYTKAFNMMKLPISQVSSSLYNVVFPAFSREQDNKENLRKGYLRIIKTISFFLFPVLIAIQVNGDYVIIGLYGEKWADSVEALKILCIAGIFKVTLSYSGALAHATGNVFKEVKQQIVFALMLFLTIYLSIDYGLIAVSWAVVASTFCLFLMQTSLTVKILEIAYVEFLRALKPALYHMAIFYLLNHVFSYIIGFLFNDYSYELKFFVVFLLNAISFISLIVLLPESIKKDTVDWVIGKYKSKIPNFVLSVYNLFNPKVKLQRS